MWSGRVYDAMGLITFFTAGTRHPGLAATQRLERLKAAATIHNDIAKGFIARTIVHFDDYATAGSLDAAYSAGKMSWSVRTTSSRTWATSWHIRNKS